MKLNDEQAVTVERLLTLEERIELQAQEIQALQQENEELRAKVREKTKWWQDEARYAIKLEQEVKQLRAQAAAMREALKNLVDSIDDANDDFEYDLIEYSKTSFEMLEAKDILSNNVTYSYHNPADADALRKAREALYHNMPYPEGTPEYKESLDAIQAIDKAIGGGKDGRV